MTLQQYPQYEPTDVKKWLTQVLGKDILFESKDSRRWTDRDSKVDPCAWQSYYTAELFLRIDLPPLLTTYFAAQLQHSLEVAIGKTINPDYWKSDRRQAAETLRHSDWPLPSAVIRDNLWIDTEKLQIVAKRLSAPAEWTGSIVSKMLTHEAAWIERKRSVSSVCDELFLGHEIQSGHVPSFGFRYGTTTGNLPGLELSLVMSDYVPPFSGERFQERNKWSDRNRELGLEGMLAYEDFHIGTHAPIDEFKFALYGVSDMEIANKLEELRKPERLAAVRQYIHEVIAATSIQNWFLHNEHPDRANDLRNIKASMPDNLAEEEQERWYVAQRSALEATPKYTLWQTVFPQLAQDHPTTGEFVQAIYLEPPAGQEEVYTRLRRWSDETFPLLKAHLDTAAPVTPAQRLSVAEKITPAPGS